MFIVASFMITQMSIHESLDKEITIYSYNDILPGKKQTIEPDIIRKILSGTE